MSSTLRLYHVTYNPILQITPRRMMISRRKRSIITPKNAITNRLLRYIPTSGTPVKACKARKLIVILGASCNTVFNGTDVVEFLKDDGLNPSAVRIIGVSLTMKGEHAGCGVHDVDVIGGRVERCEFLGRWTGGLSRTRCQVERKGLGWSQDDG